jgi:oxygen-independent coproporphyrinogen-3 oxidase
MLPVGDGAVRFQNTDELDAYMTQGPLAILPHGTGWPEPEFLGREAAFEESLFLGLRLIEGVSLNGLQAEFGDEMVASVMPGIREACEARLLLMDEDRIRLTARGRMASNEVFSRLLVPATA